MKKKIKDNKMFIISIIAILFIPVMYAANFLIAFMDPYNRLTNVDVAIVNMDNGTTYNEKEINIGEEFINELKKSDNFKWNFVSEKEALNGMKDNKYYFTVKIPDNFTENVYKTLNGNYSESNIIYMANDNKNYICGVLGNALVNELESQLNKKVISSFLVNMDTNLKDGGMKLESAINSIFDGSNKITTNLEALNGKTDELATNVSKIKDASNTLNLGTNELNNKYNLFNKYIGDISTSTSTIDKAYSSYNNSLLTYKNSLSQVLSTSNIPVEVQNELLNNYETLYQTSLYLNNNLKTIDNSLIGINNNSNAIKDSLNKINTGASTLDSYLGNLNDATIKLNLGVNSLYNGSYKLNTGINDFSKGINTFNDTINKLNLTDNSSHISSIVTRTDNSYSQVDNYGYGFAPYFISLGLFVGALITTIVLEMKKKKGNMKFDIVKVIKKVGLFAFIVIVQSIILDTVVLNIGIKVSNIPLFIGFTLLMAVTFMAIVQFFASLFGDVGRFLCIILLTLQLTACGGTFPIETAPDFYNIINPFMPMTYTVDGLRAIIGNGNMNTIITSSVVMISIIIVSYLTIFIYFKKSKKFI